MFDWYQNKEILNFLEDCKHDPHLLDLDKQACDTIDYIKRLFVDRHTENYGVQYQDAVNLLCNRFGPPIESINDVEQDIEELIILFCDNRDCAPSDLYTDEDCWRYAYLQLITHSESFRAFMAKHWGEYTPTEKF